MRSGPALPADAIAQAVVAVQGMDTQQRLALADEIFATQPNLLASVLVTHTMGVSPAELEVVLNLLLVAYQAMKSSGLRWPLITEDTQDRCMQRIKGQMRFTQGLAARQVRRALQSAIDHHPERDLLAYAYGQLKAHGLADIRSNAQQYLLLTALNLVDCIAATAPTGGDGVSHRRGG